MASPPEPEPKRARRLLWAFDRHARWRRPTLVALGGEEMASEVIADARRAYAALLPEVAALPGVEQIGAFFADSSRGLIERFPAWMPRWTLRSQYSLGLVSSQAKR